MPRKTIFRLRIFLYSVFLAACSGSGPSDFAPSVIQTDPQNKAADAPVEGPITATFSYPVDPVTVNADTFILSGVQGIVEYEGQTAAFTPSVPLAKGTNYNAVLTTGIKD
ncbi:MAG TPA: Ig-like domain-containing protein, partial [Candidatus Manganitrophaceae bacterium]|nr:Ig-like domain-containing protein [Candidatus Manganitrophaceae bacterium]